MDTTSITTTTSNGDIVAPPHASLHGGSDDLLLPWSVYLTLLNRDGSDSNNCFHFRQPVTLLFGRYVWVMRGMKEGDDVAW